MANHYNWIVGLPPSAEKQNLGNLAHWLAALKIDFAFSLLILEAASPLQMQRWLRLSESRVFR
jgi:hypothetical protein